MRTLLTIVVSLALLAAVAGCQTAPLESRNEQVVARYYEAINRSDAKGAAAEFAEDATNFGRPVGRQGIEDRLRDIFSTFPDWRMEILELSSSNEVVVVRCRVSGTHRGVGTMPLNGMPVGVTPTGRRFEVTHMHWHKLRNGKIVEHFANRDDLGMLRQLGLLPPVAK
jgi:predicted ester cyclase